MRKALVDVAGMHFAALAHERQHRLRALLFRQTPRRAHDARVHERMVRARQEPVVDEKILFDVERRIAPVEIARAVTGDAMPQHEVLRTRRRADRIGLHEPKAIERATQIGAGKKASRDRKAPQVCKLDGG